MFHLSMNPNDSKKYKGSKPFGASVIISFIERWPARFDSETFVFHLSITTAGPASDIE